MKDNSKNRKIGGEVETMEKTGDHDQNIELLYEDNRSTSKSVKPVNYSVMLPNDNSLFASERKSLIPTDGDTTPVSNNNNKVDDEKGDEHKHMLSDEEEIHHDHGHEDKHDHLSLIHI